jgi:hypothetical protein
MSLRQGQWRKSLKLPASLSLPRMHRNYLQSRSWQKLLEVVRHDLARMPPMNDTNVVRVLSRFSATAPYGGYTQGNLYLLYAIGLVYHDEQTIYWSLHNAVRFVHPFGPTTLPDARVIPAWVIAVVTPYAFLDDMTWSLLIRLRWIYVLFGQTFEARDGLLAVWDFVIAGYDNLYCMCAALLLQASTIDFTDCGCPHERASRIMSKKVLTTHATAAIISRAQQFLQCTGAPSTSTAQQARLLTRRMLTADRGSTPEPTTSTS